MTDFVGYTLLIIAIGCFVAYWLIWSARSDVSLTGAFVKAGATGVVAALLLIDVFDAPPGPLPVNALTSFAGVMGIGLAFGAVGDFALARRGERAFLLGMAAFAVGHLAYAYALWHRTRSLVAFDLAHNSGGNFGGGATTPLQVAVLLGLAALIVSTEFWLSPRTGSLRWPVRGYVLVIGAMAAAAVLLVENGGVEVLRIGAALFVLSDLLLALRLFVVTSPATQARLSLALWPAYWLGQMLIAVGAIAYGIGPKG